ncbi:MAG: putative membrane protein YczE [Maribacter sp.]|jgi:uncharacterized membrane protein YczE
MSIISGTIGIKFIPIKLCKLLKLNFKKAVKKMIQFLVGLLFILIIGVALFVNLSPEFGSAPSKKKREVFAQSSNYKDGVFRNIGNVKMEMSFGKFIKMIGGYFADNPNTTPKYRYYSFEN